MNLIMHVMNIVTQPIKHAIPMTSCAREPGGFAAKQLLLLLSLECLRFIVAGPVILWTPEHE